MADRLDGQLVQTATVEQQRNISRMDTMANNDSNIVQTLAFISMSRSRRLYLAPRLNFDDTRQQEQMHNGKGRGFPDGREDAVKPEAISILHDVPFQLGQEISVCACADITPDHGHARQRILQEADPSPVHNRSPSGMMGRLPFQKQRKYVFLWFSLRRTAVAAGATSLPGNGTTFCAFNDATSRTAGVLKPSAGPHPHGLFSGTKHARLRVGAKVMLQRGTPRIMPACSASSRASPAAGGCAFSLEAGRTGWMAGIVVRPNLGGTAPAKTETVDDRWGWYALTQLQYLIMGGGLLLPPPLRPGKPKIIIGHSPLQAQTQTQTHCTALQQGRATAAPRLTRPGCQLERAHHLSPAAVPAPLVPPPKHPGSWWGPVHPLCPWTGPLLVPPFGCMLQDARRTPLDSPRSACNSPKGPTELDRSILVLQNEHTSAGTKGVGGAGKTFHRPRRIAPSPEKE
ncbi:hypothetical protein S40288_11195 [Stachybotrys chartarum IBT 40288]|nr:hypothetical protein S40288_11195 [Stachybotrys chartarum IBT 40288]